MKILNEVLQKKVAVFTFGRMNPPTVGHEKLIKKVLDVAKSNGAKPFVFVSHTQDAKKNPLTSKQKVKYLELGSRGVSKGVFINDSKVRTPFDAVKYVKDAGYTDIIMVVGQDRVQTFKSAITPYIAHPDENKSLNIDSFDVVSAGQRDPDADDVTGMSASKMREYAIRGDYKSFRTGVLSGLSDKYAKELYDDVRAGLRIVEQLDEQIKRITNSLNIPRKDMPQIRSVHIKDFIDFLQRNDLKVYKKQIAVKDLKPTQNEINLEKVKIKYDEFVDNVARVKPFIVSKDHYILDGHHQLFALKELDKNRKVECYLIDYPMLGVIEYAKTFPKTVYKSITEAEVPTEVDKTRERQKQEIEQIKSRHFDELQKAREKDYRAKEAEKMRSEEDVDFGADNEYIYEYLEDGTTKLVDAYKRDTPGE